LALYIQHSNNIQLIIFYFMKNLKLNMLSENAMGRREMNNLVGGGGDCRCACVSGNTRANGGANYRGHLQSPDHTDHEIIIHHP
jgi:natural product precursor